MLLANQHGTVSTIAFILLFFFGSAVAAQEKSAVQPPIVSVANALQAEVIARVPVSGTLVAREEVLVNPQVNGYEITAINVDVGSRVSKGDILATLNRDTLEAQLAQAEAEVVRAMAAVSQAESQIVSAQASLTQAEAVLDRSQRLRQSGNTSQATLDQSIAGEGSARASLSSARDGLAVARAQLEQSKSQRNLAQLNLSRSEIVTPVDGQISARMAKIGAVASAGGEPLFRIIRDGEIEMEAEVIETALGMVSEGDLADLSIAGVGKIEGSVRLIAPTVDPVTRLGIVKIRLPNSEGLRAGLFAGGWITTDQHMALTVPVSAVLTDIDGSYVLAVEHDTLVKKKVIAGLIWNDRREIISGLEQGEPIVSKAGAFYASGDRITPQADDSEEPGDTK